MQTPEKKCNCFKLRKLLQIERKHLKAQLEVRIPTQPHVKTIARVMSPSLMFIMSYITLSMRNEKEINKEPILSSIKQILKHKDKAFGS